MRLILQKPIFSPRLFPNLGEKKNPFKKKIDSKSHNRYFVKVFDRDNGLLIGLKQQVIFCLGWCGTAEAYYQVWGALIIRLDAWPEGRVSLEECLRMVNKLKSLAYRHIRLSNPLLVKIPI